MYVVQVIVFIPVGYLGIVNISDNLKGSVILISVLLLVNVYTLYVACTFGI